MAQTQLDIFDVLAVNEGQPPSSVESDYKVHDQVVIRKPSSKDDPEDYYYLQDYQKMTGRIIKIHSGKRTSYMVEFNRGVFGVFYAEDFRVVL